jgi:cytochrome c peroxidase
MPRRKPWAKAVIHAAAALLTVLTLRTAIGAAPEPITPVPAPPVDDPLRVRLGQQLFADKRLSGDGSRSCTSCHDRAHGGAEGNPRPLGTDGRPLDYNAPTVLNAALSFRLNWRGNFRSLEELTDAVLLDSRLMGTTWDALLARLRADHLLLAAFRAAYQVEPGREQVLDALAAFQRSLVTQDAPFDHYLRGDRSALTPGQERGWQLFKGFGCVACHQGVNVGGNLFQRFGIFAERPVVTPADLGRFTLIGQEGDRHVFRVPSLRNVALTAPYFHDGGTATLDEAVRTMAKSQLGRTLQDQEVQQIVQFLDSLTGADLASSPLP